MNHRNEACFRKPLSIKMRMFPANVLGNTPESPPANAPASAPANVPGKAAAEVPASALVPEDTSEPTLGTASLKALSIQKAFRATLRGTFRPL